MVDSHNHLPLQRIDNLILNILIMIIKHLARPKLPTILEVPWTRRRDHGNSRGDGELDRAAPDAGAAAPDDDGAVYGFRFEGWEG